VKRAGLWRQKRREWFDGLFPAGPLFITALIIMPALLFNPDTLTRVFQFFFFWFLAWLSGRKDNPLITILIILVIVFFNLLVPYGRVIASLGIFRITAGSLLAGIHRAVTLEALVMLSRAAVRPGLRLPGAFGEILGESFRIFGLIAERGITVKGADVCSGIDRLMLELSGEASAAMPAGGPVSADGAALPKEGGSASGHLSFPALASLALAALLAWLPLLIRGIAGLTAWWPGPVTM
jgi:heptaprenyl diphosphate synthase